MKESESEVLRIDSTALLLPTVTSVGNSLQVRASAMLLLQTAGN
jgi:hypothetical protein